MSTAAKNIKSNENELLRVLIERNPNGLTRRQVHRLLPDLSDDEVDAAADGLAGRGLVAVTDRENAQVPGRVARRYALTDTARYPIQETLMVAGREIPRAVQGDVNDAEDLNAFFEVLAEYEATVEERVRSIANDMTRGFWFSIAALLGLFVAVFALISRGTELVSTTPHGSALDLFWRNLAALGPLAAILFLFVGVLALAMRWK